MSATLGPAVILYRSLAHPEVGDCHRCIGRVRTSTISEIVVGRTHRAHPAHSFHLICDYQPSRAGHPCVLCSQSQCPHSWAQPIVVFRQVHRTARFKYGIQLLGPKCSPHIKATTVLSLRLYSPRMALGLPQGRVMGLLGRTENFGYGG